MARKLGSLDVEIHVYADDAAESPIAVAKSRYRAMIQGDERYGAQGEAIVTVSGKMTLDEIWANALQIVKTKESLV